MKASELKARIEGECEAAKSEGWRFNDQYSTGGQCGCVVSACLRNIYPGGMSRNLSDELGIPYGKVFAVEAGFCGWVESDFSEDKASQIRMHPKLYEFGKELARKFINQPK